jgi:hypothetical protein
LDIKSGVLPDRVKVANIYIANTAPYWGPVLAAQTGPTTIGIAPGFVKLLSSIDPENGKSVVFTFMHGEEYVSMSTKEYAEPHDFYMPSRPDLPISPQRQVIPLAVIEKQVAFYLTKTVANFKAMRSYHPGLRIVNVVCPPPSNEDRMRLKYYLLYVQMLNDALLPLQVESLLPPPETVSQEGLLRPEFVGDLVHGNTWYGSKVVAQMKELLPLGVC